MNFWRKVYAKILFVLVSIRKLTKYYLFPLLFSSNHVEMKLQCQVEVINRAHHNLNFKTNSKHVKSTLALGKEPKCETEFFILHFSTINKSGTKYRVKNIKQVFVKCINDGKSTIRFDDPPHDLCLKSESIQLKCFMRLLQSCISGDKKALQKNSLTSLSATVKYDNAPTNLVIRDRSEMPRKGLPRTLESLTMAKLKLCNFRREILLLNHLTILDLSNNEIEKLPPELGRMKSLAELHLQNNNLGHEKVVDWRWLQEPQIGNTLRLLNLSSNKLNHLSKAIWKLQKLVTLRIDDNQIRKLPATIGRLKQLRFFSISENMLNSLPYSLLLCKLEHIDISKNYLEVSFAETYPFHFNSNAVESLVMLAAKAVLKSRIFYAPNIIPHTLVKFLDNANMCICGAPTITHDSPIIKNFDLKDHFNVVVFNNRCSAAKFECFSCSNYCLRKLFAIRPVRIM